MRRSIILVVFAACLAAIVAGGAPAIAQEGPPPATNIRVANGQNPGEVVITWDAVPEAAYYRIASVNMETDYPLALASPTGNWLAAFIYADVDAANFAGDRPSYTIRRLEQGVLHAFLVGTNTSLFGQPTWPVDPVWQWLTVAVRTPEPTPEPATPVVETLEQRVRAVLVQITADLPDGTVGNGTGLIISPDGRVITNRSAVGAADMVRIHLPTSSGNLAAYDGTVLGTDILSDLALIRMDTGRVLTPLEWADSDEVVIDAAVTAWGYPPGDISGTLPNATRGAIASIGVSHDAAGFQTNAVNAVNGGGPLTDAEGKVIGIGVAPANGEPPFAISSNHVVGLLETLAAGTPASATYRGSRFGYGYSANIPAGWHLVSESAEIAEFQHPERKAYFAIVAHDLSGDAEITAAADPLRAFAERRQNELVQQAEAESWALYEESSFESVEAGDVDHFRLEYRWARDPRHCAASETEIITLSASYPDPSYGFVAVGGTCADALDTYGEQVQQMLTDFVP